ncbi:hypothetical protein DBR24_05315 [Pseudomonas sp. HMWF006]|nr:hypothetical protein DBR24_05315 [Pseudomonas sp. HMWF006]PTT91672.1 hypothetical protein DBR29_10720 [Pseudomonas sp. HMWF005]
MAVVNRALAKPTSRPVGLHPARRAPLAPIDPTSRPTGYGTDPVVLLSTWEHQTLEQLLKTLS